MTTTTNQGRLATLLLMLVLALVAGACASDDGDAAGSDEELGDIVVGSTNFDEQELVAEMYALSLESAGFTVERRYQLGAREVVLPALTSGEIDVYPEYVGTALEFLNDGAGEATVGHRGQYRPVARSLRRGGC